MTPLPDDMAWLDGLSDEEYDAYWDEVERCAPLSAFLFLSVSYAIVRRRWCHICGFHRSVSERLMQERKGRP